MWPSASLSGYGPPRTWVSRRWSRLPWYMATGSALLPDIDHPQSWVGRRTLLISRPLAAVFGHRGFTHSILAVVACFVLLHWRGLGRAVVDPVVVGYLSHLGADLLTSSGLPLAWPLRWRFAIPLCRTGSPVELIIVAVVVAWVGSAALGLIRPWGGSLSCIIVSLRCW